MIVIEAVLGLVALLLWLPAALLCAEVLLAATRRPGAAKESAERGRLAIVMPAHDEAFVITSTIRAVLAQLERCDRMVVVADNCTDDTATLASVAGAEVIVRQDPDRRGKGYALDFGVRHLESDAPDTVMVIDADCEVGDGAIDTLARACSRTGGPVQALYLLRSPKHANPKSRIAEFALMVKNQVRPSGLHRLGLPCQLMGTGMAFPWASIRAAKLASGHIAEDLKLGVDLACAGKPPVFCPDALVTSTFPESSEGTQTQRTRWEHGHLSVILVEAPRLALHAILRMDLKLLMLALDLAVPPLALLSLLLSAVWLLTVLFWVLTKAQIPLAIATSALGLLLIAVMLSWYRFGRHILSFGDLSHAFLYALAKLPVYARFVMARQIDWVRSKRDG
jgi:cellulose synthase/poly-beta-1,6-N-acetylglucosamine synthase-like glycosyltransferase